MPAQAPEVCLRASKAYALTTVVHVAETPTQGAQRLGSSCEADHAVLTGCMLQLHLLWQAHLRRRLLYEAPVTAASLQALRLS